MLNNPNIDLVSDVYIERKTNCNGMTERKTE